jgi:drug/metabolite transporter (DMT)-like permease
MKHRLTPQQYGILLTVMLTAAVGDTLLSHGMAQVGAVNLHHLGLLFLSLKNLWVVAGILCLIGFFATYLTALSWADLTFVLPATSFSYVVVALISHFWLHEHISVMRWAGILLIVGGVGFVSQGPALTEHPAPLPEDPHLPQAVSPDETLEVRS